VDSLLPRSQPNWQGKVRMKPLFRSCSGHVAHDHLLKGDADGVPDWRRRLTVIERVRARSSAKREWHSFVQFLRAT
jgi:hypothetical protein